MNMGRRSFIAIILGTSLVVTAPCVHSTDVESRMPQPVRNILARYKLPPDSLSLYVKEQNSAQPIVELNIDTPRNPASVIKLLTTFAGLELLGPNYTWETHFHLDGRLENQTLNGNLILQGGGDPFLVGETFWHILYSLQGKGLKHIHGDLLIDDGLFEDETGSTGDFDNKPYHVYNVFPDAALINFRAHQFYFVPQENTVHIYTDPPAANLQIRNKLRLTNGKCRGWDQSMNMSVFTQGSQATVEFNGDYPGACGEQNITRSVLQNDQYIYGVFKSLWESMGGTITGTFGKAPAYDDDRPFYVIPSKPLSEIITYINKFSNNVMARQLLLTIGQEIKDTRGSKESGEQAIKEWLDHIGIHAPELVLDNGSGLSRNARISARTLGLLLEHAYQSPYQPEFFASLSLAGIDGTMRKRLNGNIPAGNARIKTGLINDVRAMAGYVRSKNNRDYFVVALQNYSNIQNYNGTKIQDEILKWLYEQ